VKLLVEKLGESVDAKDVYGRTPLMLASLANDERSGNAILRLLLSYGASVWPHASSLLSPNSIMPTFQTIATCRDGFKNSRDKSATSPFASGKRGNQRRPRQDTGKSAASRTNQRDVMVCRGRHGEVAIMEYGL